MKRETGAGEEKEGRKGRAGRGEKEGEKGIVKKAMKEEKRGWTIGFWYVAGLKNKDTDFWEKLKEWELVETWVERKEWEGIRGRLPKEYIWEIQWTEKECKRGKAKGGMLMGIRKELIDKEKDIQGEGKGIIIGSIRNDEQRWRIIRIHVRQNLKEVLQKVENWMEKKESGLNTIMGADFNARTGEMEAGMELSSEVKEEEREKRKRKSKDKKMNRKGKLLVDFLEERKWGILNGSKEGDEQGEYTFTGGAGNSD